MASLRYGSTDHVTDIIFAGGIMVGITGGSFPAQYPLTPRERITILWELRRLQWDQGRLIIPSVRPYELY
jgi:hypothetical protein